MVDVTILAMSEDQGWLASFWSAARRLKGSRLVLTGSMDEAFDLLDCAGARLLVLDRKATTFTLEQLDRLLWANSTLVHPASVLVIDRTYSAEVALTLFQMGVDDYLCSSLPAPRLAAIVSQLVNETQQSESLPGPALPAYQRMALGPTPGSVRPAVALA